MQVPCCSGRPLWKAGFPARDTEKLILKAACLYIVMNRKWESVIIYLWFELLFIFLVTWGMFEECSLQWNIPLTLSCICNKITVVKGIWLCALVRLLSPPELLQAGQLVCRSRTTVCETTCKRTATGIEQILNIKEICGVLGEFCFSNKEGKKIYKAPVSM